MIDLPAYDSDNWQNQAQCALMRVDPAIMHPDQATRAEVEKAKRVCVGCPVLDECRRHADGQEPGAYGVHAGEWFGDEPVWLAIRTCEAARCAAQFRCLEQTATPRRFCGTTCRQRHHRAQLVAP